MENFSDCCKFGVNIVDVELSIEQQKMYIRIISMIARQYREDGVHRIEYIAKYSDKWKCLIVVPTFFISEGLLGTPDLSFYLCQSLSNFISDYLGVFVSVSAYNCNIIEDKEDIFIGNEQK